MQGDDYPDKCPTEHAYEQLENQHLAHLLEEAELRWAEEQAATAQRITETVEAATSAGMNVRLWQAGRDMLAEMIDSTENGDAIREDFESDQVAQGILLEAFEAVRLAFDTVNGVLRQVDPKDTGAGRMAD